MQLKIEVRRDEFKLAEKFTISRGSKTVAEVVTVTISQANFSGRGECVPYARYGESVSSVCKQVQGLSHEVDHAVVQQLLPAGAARNAVDCALWDLRAKTLSRSVSEIAGLPEPGSVVTAYTLSLGSPEEMRIAALQHHHRPLLKIKLGTPNDMARLEAVRQGAPNARIIVDANEGWTADIYAELAPHLVRLGVELVEQPLPADADEMLAEIERPLPVCADESCHDRSSLADLAGKYDMINIKLDKTGGLSEALALRTEARKQGFGIMVGCMVGSSLAMAPAVLLAQGADFVDLDGPLLLAQDRENPLQYDAAGVHPPDQKLWG